MTSADYRPIADDACLSDCHSTAFVSSHGSIDWACLRRFDAGSVFAKILDADRGGFFSIRPVADIIEADRRYRPSTMVLETTMRTEHGAIRCADTFAMSAGGANDPAGELLRRVECVDGSVEIEVVIEPRFDYGSTRPWLRSHDDNRSTAIGGDDALVVHSSIPLTVERERCRLSARIMIRPDEPFTVTMVSQAAHLVDIATVDVSDLFDKMVATEAWWKKWSKQTEVSGDHAELPSRSATAPLAAMGSGVCVRPPGSRVFAFEKAALKHPTPSKHPTQARVRRVPQ